MNIEGEPVEFNVAEIFIPIIALLPIPVIIILPLIFPKKSIILSKFLSNDFSSLLIESIWLSKISFEIFFKSNLFKTLLIFLIIQTVN